MTPIQPTVTITVDGENYEVANMSNEVQQMVQYLDTWRQEEANQASDLLKTRAALRDLQNTLLQQIQNEKKAEEEAASEEAPVAEESKAVEGTVVE